MSDCLQDIEQLWREGFDEHDIAIKLKAPIKVVLDAVYTYSAEWSMEEDESL